MIPIYSDSSSSNLTNAFSVAPLSLYTSTTCSTDHKVETTCAATSSVYAWPATMQFIVIGTNDDSWLHTSTSTDSMSSNTSTRNSAYQPL